ncbi:MAG: tetratricopeptide repeat protein [Acidobacteriota bacterium]
MDFRAAAAVAGLMVVAACASTGARPAPTPGNDLMRRFVLDSEYVPPAPVDLPRDVRGAWNSLRSGDAAGARQTLAAVTDDSPGRDTAEGMLLLGTGSVAQARTRFQQALAQAPTYATALYGLGFAAEAEGNRTAGLDWYQQAVDADPTLSVATVRLQVLRLEQAQALIAAGEQAEATGDTAAAVSSYDEARQLAPNVLEPYLRTAAIDSAAGRNDQAVSILRQARDRIGDLPVVLEPLGNALQATGAYAEAYDVFQALQAVEPDDPDAAALVAAARELYFTTSLPEEYRELDSKAQITRADLAALIAIRLEDLADLVEEPLSGVIIVDVADSWARDYIYEVVSWGIMQLFQNHSFGPDLVIKRQYFAEVAYRIVDLLGATEGAPRARLSDVATEHYFYDQIRVVVGLGILETGPRDTFGLLEPVSGEEAVAAVQRLVRLARSRIGQ